MNPLGYGAATLCPDGIHKVYASADARADLLGLPTDLRARVVRMLCDIAEVAYLTPSVDHWDVSKLLRLRAGRAVVMYSVDERGLLVHHIDQARVA
ncbi:MAG: hypothetical protein ACXWLM_01135 [Myxococcales bacterium]